MSDILKIIEVLSESEESWEDAASLAIRQIAKTIRNIKSIYIKEFEAQVKNSVIVSWQINAQVSFLVD